MPAAAAAAEPAEQRRDGVAESHTVIQTHRKDGKGLLKVPNVTEKWRPHAAQPTRMKPEPETIDGPRHARRPSAKAKKVGKRRATDLGWADEYDLPEEWSEEDEPMPDEDAEEDCGWRAGPIERERKPFLGPKPGPTNEELTVDSSRSDIMAELISDEFKSKWCEYTCEHAEAYREEHENWESNRIEQAMLKPRKLITPATFDLWIAIRIRLAELKPEINVARVWTTGDHLLPPRARHLRKART